MIRMFGNNTTIGYWGPQTATIDWCENNYVYSSYVAEWWNTWSNLAFVVLGTYGLLQLNKVHYTTAAQTRRFFLQYLSFILIGLGSAAFHGTLRFVEQQCDEIPMIWGVTVWLYTLYSGDWLKRSTTCHNVMLVLILLYMLAFSLLHYQHRFTTGFQVGWGGMAAACSIRFLIYYYECAEKQAKRVAQVYILSGLAGFGCWLGDFHLCDQIQQLPFNPQGHAWWHVLIGIHSYCGLVFMQYIHAKELNLNPIWRPDSPFSLPTVISKPKHTKQL